MIYMPLLLDKEESPSEEIIRLFEKTRVAYLSAREDPKEYGGRWRNAVETLQQAYSKTNALSSVLEDYIDEKLIEDKDAKDPQTPLAEKLYAAVKDMRMNAEEANDPFTKKFKDKVLEALLGEPETMAKFVHYALRMGNDALPEKVWSIKDMEPDTITDGYAGLDLEVDDIPLYIVEQYGDGKDSKKVDTAVEEALDMLEMFYLSEHKEKEWEEVKDIEKSATEKSQSDFIIPNKPMYRIFDIEDLNELRGFSGDWVIQEKYDGMRIQLHKIDGSVKIYSYNEKDITDKCPEQVKELKKKEYGDCIFDAELILFDGDEALHRADTISHVFKNKYPDAKLRVHVFDVMRHENRNLVEEPLEDRITILFNNYSSKSSDAIAYPSKKDTRMADNLKDIKEYSEEIMEMPTAEGVVIKDATSTYYIGTRKNPKWIKWKKFVDLDLIVLDKRKTKSNLFSYTLGAGPAEGEGKHFKEVDGRTFMDVGKALNTKISADIGDIIRVKVDEVKASGDRFTVFSAKVIEIPEVEQPDKLVTLEMLSKDTKRSLNYDVRALEKGIQITDHIHGDATLIIKSDFDGFTIYGFEQSNLMSKNAIADLDMWKAQAEEVMKTKQSLIASAIIVYLQEQGPKSPKEVHNFLVKNKPSEYEDILESSLKKLPEWANQRDGINYDATSKKLSADADKVIKEPLVKAYKTPEEYRAGVFKLYMRKDDNLDLSIKVGDENLVWFIDLQGEDALFELFGKAGKFPAQVSKTKDREKLVDKGSIELGVQKEGYHEYFLKGNKFETKLHIRVVPVDGKEMWLAWTGYKQTPADKKSDTGLWNIYNDRYNKLTIPS